MKLSKVLIIEDDGAVRENLKELLMAADYNAITAINGIDGLEKIHLMKPDLILCDINMPEMDGLEVCREIRKTSNLPIVFLSSRDDEIDRILGLELGGDDYVTKPFSPRELVARINAILKRTQHKPAEPHAKQEALSIGKLTIFPDQHRACWGEQDITLTATEFAILLLLAQRPVQVFSRDHIMQKAYDSNVYVSDRTIDSHIRHIRQKFTDIRCESIIETVHGVGYKLATCK